MIKVLGLARYGNLAASTRYRLKQYISGLKKNGIELEINFLFSDKYLVSRFNNKFPSLANIVYFSYLRFLKLLNVKKYDVLIIYCEIYPLIPAFIERFFLRKPFIYDYDDAFYLKYRHDHLSILNIFLGKKFDKIIKYATAINAGNKHLSNYAKNLNDSIIFFPTVVDTNLYRPTKKYPNEILTIGWIGSPSTVFYLNELIIPLSKLGEESLVKFIVIGGKAPFIKNVSVDEISWNEETEIDEINKFDIGVMPLPNNSWTKGKCAFKLIQYMACGLPVIASKVGANIDLVNKDCGYLVNDDNSWLVALRKLRDNPDLRKKFGNASRNRIINHYSLHKNLPKLVNTIRNIVN